MNHIPSQFELIYILSPSSILKGVICMGWLTNRLDTCGSSLSFAILQSHSFAFFSIIEIAHAVIPPLPLSYSLSFLLTNHSLH